METAQLDRHEQSMLLYLETCLVDGGARAEGIRMNQDDYEAAKRLEKKEICFLRRLKSKYIQSVRKSGIKKYTHYAEFTDLGWRLAHQLRRERAARVLDKYGPSARDVVGGMPVAGGLNNVYAAPEKRSG